MKYRVTCSRYDVHFEIAGIFEAEDDETARVIFEERFKNNKHFAWDFLTLVRIDQEEKTTYIESSTPNDRRI